MSLVSKFYGNAYQPVTPQTRKKRTRSADKPIWHVKASPGQLWKEKNNYKSKVRVTKVVS
jgi:hypothetical protein